MDLLKYQILETTKTFILNTRFISCRSTIGNLSMFARMIQIKIIGERFLTKYFEQNVSIPFF
jgi:hypothetical protein